MLKYKFGKTQFLTIFSFAYFNKRQEKNIALSFGEIEPKT